MGTLLKLALLPERDLVIRTEEQARDLRRVWACIAPLRRRLEALANTVVTKQKKRRGVRLAANAKY